MLVLVSRRVPRCLLCFQLRFAAHGLGSGTSYSSVFVILIWRSYSLSCPGVVAFVYSMMDFLVVTVEMSSAYLGLMVKSVFFTSRGARLGSEL